VLGPADHLTLLAADPPRDSVFARWPVPNGEPVDLALPDRQTVPAELIGVNELLDELVAVAPDADRTRSVRAWAEVARFALAVVAAGHLRPAVSPDGFDQWVAGPLSEREREVRAALAGWLPPEAHCAPLPVAGPPRILPASDAVTAALHAIADALPRTAAAEVVAGQSAWAGTLPVEVSALRSRFAADDAAERTVVCLRLGYLPAPVGPTTEEETPPGTGLDGAPRDRSEGGCGDNLAESSTGEDVDLLDEGLLDGVFALDVVVRSATDPTLIAPASDLWEGRAPGFDHQTESDVLLALRRGAKRWAPLARLLDDPAPSQVELSPDEAIDLFGPLALDLAEDGLTVLIPTGLARTLEPAATVAPPPGAGDTPTRLDLGALCRLRWSATLDGEPLTDEELSRLAASRRALVRLRGQWVVVDRNLVARLGRDDELPAATVVAGALGGRLPTLDDVAATVAPTLTGGLEVWVNRLRANIGAPIALPEPAGLTATLRPYQRRGVGWLAELADLGVGGILADDMGLGKTVQLIALHLHRMGTHPDGGPTLIVCPATLVANWERELERFAPGLRVHRFHGAGRSLEEVRPGDVVVTTYGLVRRDPAALAAVPWGLAVADEAQFIKNPNSGVARAIRQIPAPLRIAMTGTPVENRLTELWALLDWTTPGLLGGVETFRRTLAIPIERDRDPDALAALTQTIAPFVLRRRKTDPDIVPDLPPKTETDHLVTLTEEQAGLYRAVVEEVFTQITTSEGIARRGLVLKLLTSLKQVCNHPAHYLGQPGPLRDRSGKLAAFDDLVDAIVEAGDATLVFTQYVAMGQLLVDHLTQRGIEARFLHGGLTLGQRSELVDAFARGDVNVFVVSLKAGGTGLNLVRATHVIHYDRWWNPAVEQQASDRAWRIGQDRPVQVHRLICQGTLEERIAEVIAGKTALADAVVGSGESWLGEISDDELAALISLDEEGPP
jgi:hypothetical protein